MLAETIRTRLVVPPWIQRHGLVLAAAGAFLLLFLTVWGHARVDRLQISLDREQQRGRRLQSQIVFLGNDAHRGSSLGEVEVRAEGLGMTTPQPDQITVLNLGPAAEPTDGRRLVVVSEAYAAPPRPDEARR